MEILLLESTIVKWIASAWSYILDLSVPLELSLPNSRTTTDNPIKVKQQKVQKCF